MSKNQIMIRRFNAKDENQLFDLLEREGEEWSCYWGGENREKYAKALENSINYLLFSENELCGYIRCRDDDGFGVYVYDLLVDKSHRGKEFGRLLMEQVCDDFFGNEVYVLGDNYPYYEKLGYAIEGTIYIVKPKMQ